MCVGVWAWTCHSAYVKEREKPLGVCSSTVESGDQTSIGKLARTLVHWGILLVLLLFLKQDGWPCFCCCFLLSWLFSYTVDINPLSDIYFVNIFPNFVVCLIVLLSPLLSIKLYIKIECGSIPFGVCFALLLEVLFWGIVVVAVVVVYFCFPGFGVFAWKFLANSLGLSILLVLQDQNFKSNQNKHVFVVLHHPVFSPFSRVSLPFHYIC